MGRTITTWTARAATLTGATLLCGGFQGAHGQSAPESTAVWPAVAHSSALARNTQRLRETQALNLQSMDIGSRVATMAMTRHRLLAGFQSPLEETRVPPGNCSLFMRDAHSQRRSHPVHGGELPPDPPAKTVESRESFQYQE